MFWEKENRIAELEAELQEWKDSSAREEQLRRSREQENSILDMREKTRYISLFWRANDILDIGGSGEGAFISYLDRIEREQKEQAELKVLTQKVEKILQDRGLLPKAKKG